MVRRRIRIIYKQGKPTFSEQLEERARRFVNRRRETTSPIETAVLDEIALTLDHLVATRTLHADLRRQLLRLECYIDTEIMQREPKPPFFYDERIAERDMLRKRLLAIAQEGRRIAISEIAHLRILSDRLAEAFARRRLLNYSW